MKPTSQILMIKPESFGHNEQTATSNLFQNQLALSQSNINQLARDEFDNMVNLLKQHNINVTVVNDTTSPLKPDAIFPNNWITTHMDGSIYLFPMAAKNRQYERREDIILMLKENHKVSKVVDLSYTEQDNRFLEGTGSIVFDHANKTAFACLSPRTERDLFSYYCHEIGYKSIYFTATDLLGNEIYHTNVMMCIGQNFAVVCLDSVENDFESNQIVKHFNSHNKELIEISREQMNQFAGNMIELRNANNEHFIITSKTAYNSLSEEQIERISQYATFLTPDIPTIEKVGGGSVRCMIAENFLPLK
jgi:hypothetical protein